MTITLDPSSVRWNASLYGWPISSRTLEELPSELIDA